MNHLDEVREAAALALEGIAQDFKPGAKLTLIVRTPDNNEADFVLTDDDLLEAIEVLHRSRYRERKPITDNGRTSS